MSGGFHYQGHEYFLGDFKIVTAGLDVFDPLAQLDNKVHYVAVGGERQVEEATTQGAYLDEVTVISMIRDTFVQISDVSLDQRSVRAVGTRSGALDAAQHVVPYVVACCHFPVGFRLTKFVDTDVECMDVFELLG